MPITGHFEADFSQFQTGVDEATSTLQKFAKDSTGLWLPVEQSISKVPPALKATTAETKVASAAFVDMGSLARQAGGMITGAFTVGAIVSFGQEVLNTADSIGKLATQTGMTQKEVQQLQFISTQTSVSMGALTGAAQQLAADLGSNDSKLIGALHDLNISVGDFKKLDPYQQMVTLSRAVQGIEDPFKQAAAAEAVFHKNWKEIYPAMKADMEAIGAQAPVMADSLLKGLQQTKSRIDELKSDTIAIGGFLVYAIAKTVDFFSGNEAVRLGLAAGRKEAADAADVQRRSYEALLKELPKVPAATLPIIEGFKAIKLTAEEAKVQEDSWTAAITERLAKEKEAVDFQAAMKSHYEEVATLQEEIFGYPALKKAATWSDAMLGLKDDVGQLSAEMRTELQTALVEAQGAMQKLGLLESDQSKRYSEIISKIDTYNMSMRTTAEEVVPAASGVVTEYTQKLYDAAVAEDKEAEAIARKNAQLAATQALVGAQAMAAQYAAANVDYAPFARVPVTGGEVGYMAPRRAAGGPVLAGQSYYVGEQGPELFTPGSSGSISPHGAGGTLVQNTFHLVDTEANLARRVSDLIMRSVMTARRV